MNRCLSVIVSCCAIVLATSGCRYWYKPGSTSAELQRDEAACREQSSGDTGTPEFGDCMHALGWSGAQSNKPAATAGSPAQGDHAKAVPARPDDPAGPSRPEPSQAESVPAVAPMPAEQSTEPDMQGPAITSWWKLGGSPDLLSQDQDACLGISEEYLPGDAIAWETSRELQKCMEDRGWRPLH